jgi:uncharacterized membrane protein (UPF0127 family)
MARLLQYVLCFVVFFASVQSGAFAQSAPTTEPAGIDLVVIVTEKGQFPFKTEMALTDSQRMRGLMFRQRLPADRAMLFDWGRDLQARMWMKNTYISLDMIFIRRDGKVANIVRGTTPKSLEVISSEGMVAAVMEVAAGTADRIGLKPGDHVLHPLLVK